MRKIRFMDRTDIKRSLMNRALWMEVLNWRNEPLVYAWARTNRPITLSEHQTWFENRKDKFDQQPIFSYCAGDSLIGMSRIDFLSGDTYEVSLLINPEYRGKGYGKFVLKDTCWYFSLNMPPDAKLIATIHAKNNLSQHVFERNGFRYLFEVSNFKTFIFRKSYSDS